MTERALYERDWVIDSPPVYLSLYESGAPMDKRVSDQIGGVGLRKVVINAM